MWKLVPVVAISLALALFSDLFSRKDPMKNRYVYQEKFLWIFIIVTMAIFAGLRVGYNDTSAYIHSYNLLSKEFDLSRIDYSFGANPGFNILNMLMKSLGITSQGFIMVYSVLTYMIYIWFIHKYSSDFLMSMFLFVCLVFTFPLAAIKQCVSVAFCLVAVDKAINKKWFWFVFWIFIAEIFHAYSFLYLIVPLLFFVPWQDKRTIYWVLIFLVSGLMLKPLLGTVLNVTDMLGEEYTVDSFSGEGVNPLRVLVCLVPLVMSFILRKKVNSPEYDVTRAEGLCMNLSFLNGEIMFVGLFGTANYFARLANYFYIFPIIALPRLFNMVAPKWRAPMKVAVVVCYFFFFYYSEYIVYGHFDNRFKSIPIGDFSFFS